MCRFFGITKWGEHRYHAAATIDAWGKSGGAWVRTTRPRPGKQWGALRPRPITGSDCDQSRPRHWPGVDGDDHPASLRGRDKVICSGSGWLRLLGNDAGCPAWPRLTPRRRPDPTAPKIFPGHVPPRRSEQRGSNGLKSGQCKQVRQCCLLGG